MCAHADVSVCVHAYVCVYVCVCDGIPYRCTYITYIPFFSPKKNLQIENADNTCHPIAVPNFEGRLAIPRDISEKAVTRRAARQASAQHTTIWEYQLAQQIEIVHFGSVRGVHRASPHW